MKVFLVSGVHCGALPPGSVSVLYKASDVFAMRPIIHLLMCSIISVIDLPLLHSRHQNTVTSSTDSDPPPRSPHPYLAGTQRHGQVPRQWDEVHERWRSGQWQHWKWHITPCHGIKAFWRKWPPEENQVKPGEGKKDGVWQRREIVPSRKICPPPPRKAWKRKSKVTVLRMRPPERPPFPLPSGLRIQCSADFSWAPRGFCLHLLDLY